MSNHVTIGIRGLGCALPGRFESLHEIPLRSQPETLADSGFTGAFVADDVHSLAATAARQALDHAGLRPNEIGALLCANALPQAQQQASSEPEGGVLDTFCYSASWLQEELGLESANVSGISQQGCAGMFSALRIARALLIAETELDHVLCVGADALPPGSCREILYNVISDAACAAVVSRSRVRHRWLAYHQLSKGYYWDVPARQSEIIAAYFPSARMAIGNVLRQAGVRADEIDLVIPTGVSASSWPILLRLCGIPEERLYRAKTRFGHTVAADSLLLLREAAETGALSAGMRVLLFTYGFGSSWCALVLEVAEGEVRP